MAKYFADTYALIEILKGNPNYRSYSAEELYTTEFNLLELSYALVRDFGSKKAEEILEIVKSTVNVVSPSIHHYVLALPWLCCGKELGNEVLNGRQGI